jgi:hypothetical protein
VQNHNGRRRPPALVFGSADRRTESSEEKEGARVIHLAAVEGSHRQGSQAEEIRFCSYCGRIGGDERQRVCRACGLGVQLRTHAEALKSDGAPFLIVRADGTVSAMSASAEKEFGDLVARQLLSVLESRDLSRAVAAAAEGKGGLVMLLARPLVGRRFRPKARVTVAPCGDPLAALVVVERA